MKKVFFSAALALAVAASWAFHPKAADPGGYMMVIGSGFSSGFNSYSATITVVQPNGERQTEGVDTRLFSRKDRSGGFVDLHKAELLQVNQLAAQGWRVISVTQSNSIQGNINETNYLLEKR